MRIGCQTPRISLTPKFAANAAAQDVAAMAELVGMPLDEWQMRVCEGALGEDADGRWAAFEAALVVPRQAGKSALLQAMILAALFVWEERTVIYSAHLFSTAQEIFNSLRRLLNDNEQLLGEVAKVYTANGKEAIILKNGCRVKFMARGGGGGVGFSGDRIIFDEAWNLDPKAISAMIPTLAARSMRPGSSVQVWYASSAAHAHSLVLHSLRQRAQMDDPGRLAYFEWSAPEGSDLNDVDAWYQANPALGIRISEDYVRDEFRSMQHSPDEFARERLGIPEPPVALGGAVKIPAMLWPLSVIGGGTPEPRTLAFDVAPGGAWSSVAWAGGDRSDPYVEVARHEKGTAWLPLQLAKMQADIKAARIAWDEAGPAADLVPAIREAFTAAGLDINALKGMPSKEYRAACGAFLIDATELGPSGRPRLRRLAGQVALDSAADGATERVVGDAWVWDRRSATVPISPLVAVTVARALLMGDEKKDLRIW